MRCEPFMMMMMMMIVLLFQGRQRPRGLQPADVQKAAGRSMSFRQRPQVEGRDKRRPRCHLHAHDPGDSRHNAGLRPYRSRTFHCGQLLQRFSSSFYLFTCYRYGLLKCILFNIIVR